MGTNKVMIGVLNKGTDKGNDKGTDKGTTDKGNKFVNAHSKLAYLLWSSWPGLQLELSAQHYIYITLK